MEDPGRADLDIGVDRFHADQKQAEALERDLRAGPDRPAAFAIVSAGADGKARLKGLVIGDKRLTLSWF
jgi:hypothetical protein